MALRDLTGAVDFSVLEAMTDSDAGIMEEVLGLFVQQAELWAQMLDARQDGWRDAVHTLRGAAGGIGAHAVAEACLAVERIDAAGAPPLLNRVCDALNAALADVAAYRHALMLESLKA